jgi:hypothetical protein
MAKKDEHLRASWAGVSQAKKAHRETMRATWFANTVSLVALVLAVLALSRTCGGSQ